MTSLLLIPGLISDAIVWQSVADSMQSRLSVRNADHSSGDSLTGMAERLLSEHAGELIVCGHSMGGRIAMEMARLAPARIRGLILADTGQHPLQPGEEKQRLAVIRLAHQGMDRLADWWLPPMVDERRVGDEALMQPLRDMVLRADADLHERHIRALMSRPDASAYLRDIHCPVLVLVGRQDRWSPVEQHEAIADALPNATLAIIEDAGHFAPFERPDEVARAVRDWYDTTFHTDDPS